MNALTPLVSPQVTVNGPLTLPPITTPSAPALSSAAGGAIGATTYYVRVTIVSSSGGQTLGSTEASLAVAASRLLVIGSPTNPQTANALGWYPYVGTTPGAETLQTGAVIPFGTPWTLPTTGLIAGSAPPLLNQTAGTVSVGALSCLGFTFGLIAGTNSSLAFPGSQMTFYAGASPVALITSAGAVTAASYAAGSSSYGATAASVNGPVTATSHIAGTSSYGAAAASVAGPITFAGGSLSALGSPIGTQLQPLSTGGFTIRNAAGTTSPLTLSDTGALVILGSATKPGGGAWTNPSDERLKRNIEPHTDGLAVIRALRPIIYEYNGRGGTPDTGTRHVGLSAQAAQAVIPRAVGHMHALLDPDDDDATDLLTVDPSELIYTLCNAVRELAAQVEALQAALAAPEPASKRKAKVATVRSAK